jgi:hypothetical protein
MRSFAIAQDDMYVASSSNVPQNNLSFRIPTNRSLRRFGGMRDLLPCSRNFLKMCIKISSKGEPAPLLAGGNFFMHFFF